MADESSSHHRHRERRRRDRRPADVGPEAPRPEAASEARDADKVLRGLVGAGPSMLSLDAAMRARDASRPTDEDLADAEQNLTIVRRQYVPTETLPPGIRPANRPQGSGGS
ncbi:hypothetical protein [Cryptosporangium aurantiacum]|uniref:Uncharacterized protein n=1 Tax=Cryptosporangium aurantiacum TaxID=134849 RepID=A0A1M7Q8S0_9ACTN|nr:hypothetical protein [Cryptosporangium aurantiacum]SHN26797.1 hypothetical protein SAMN05443668_104304 [Cryptosporangium aurantiacum]